VLGGHKTDEKSKPEGRYHVKEKQGKGNETTLNYKGLLNGNMPTGRTSRALSRYATKYSSVSLFRVFVYYETEMKYCGPVAEIHSTLVK
jgi:hypothetical protein